MGGRAARIARPRPRIAKGQRGALGPGPCVAADAAAAPRGARSGLPARPDFSRRPPTDSGIHSLSFCRRFTSAPIYFSLVDVVVTVFSVTAEFVTEFEFTADIIRVNTPLRSRSTCSAPTDGAFTPHRVVLKSIVLFGRLFRLQFSNRCPTGLYGKSKNIKLCHRTVNRQILFGWTKKIIIYN